jgi:hypothetical protein
VAAAATAKPASSRRSGRDDKRSRSGKQDDAVEAEAVKAGPVAEHAAAETAATISAEAAVAETAGPDAQRKRPKRQEQLETPCPAARPASHAGTCK